MSFALVTTQHFERRARKLLRKHPDLRPTLRDTLDDLSRGIPSNHGSSFISFPVAWLACRRSASRTPIG